MDILHYIYISALKHQEQGLDPGIFYQIQSIKVLKCCILILIFCLYNKVDKNLAGKNFHVKRILRPNKNADIKTNLAVDSSSSQISIIFMPGFTHRWMCCRV